MSSATAHVDGGARGNPGPAGYGVRITRDDGSIVDLKASIGITTNNVAEYHGLLAALQWAADDGVASLTVKADSELMVKQMLGQYRVKNAGLQPLYEEARRLVVRIGRVKFEHVRREFNKDADRLANEAMNEAGSPPPIGRPSPSRRDTT